MNIKRNNRGFSIIAVIGIMVISLILMEGLVLWLQNEAKWAVKYKRSTTAFHLAEAGIDRGVWKLKSSTGTWGQASTGIVIAGYDFDTTYKDVPGGHYRIRFSSGPGSQEVTIVSEGRDPSTNEVRSVQVVYSNQTIPAAIISGGIITWSNKLEVHWGPVMSHGNIVIESTASMEYSPRKFSRQVVSCQNVGNARDQNGLDPPNTDNAEWWSDYAVPDLPVLDFATLRASANSTSTLNVYTCDGGAKGPWGCNGSGAHGDDFQDSDGHADSKKNFVWYWDNDVEFTGGSLINGIGIYGTVIVRGNMKIGKNTGDNYAFVGNVPEDAWEEYEKITKTTGDTAAVDEYPADAGYQKNNATFSFGNESWRPTTKAAYTDVGFRGFLYVGGDLDIQGPCDYYGALWVVGNISKTAGIERSLVFFDDSLEGIPVLNVVLKKESWREIAPDHGTAWP